MTQNLPGLEFTRYTADQARQLRELVDDIYRRSYVEAIASGNLFDTSAEFLNRFDAYTSRSDTGFELVVARIHGKAAGQTWGWPLPPNARWWEGLRLNDSSADPAAFAAEDGRRTFALSEIMVCSEYTGQGIGRALHDELMGGRPEQRATLLVELDNTRAYERYKSWGWHRVGTLRPSWPDAPEFDVLIRELR
ncbi:GNAT family N-acetyltransferase [Nocardia sp. 2YAB30]|uniref:GNAT family N-acetyltransferase n=1 Tax=unclassified Nocardia TaxID=2637762 RepID=UPI003F99D6CF